MCHVLSGTCPTNFLCKLVQLLLKYFVLLIWFVKPSPAQTNEAASSTGLVRIRESWGTASSWGERERADVSLVSAFDGDAGTDEERVPVQFPAPSA